MWEVSTDPKDPIPLSPAMLLTLKDAPHPAPLETYSAEDLFSYGAKRWRRIQFIANTFWLRWRTYYLSDLQERTKWIRRKRNVQVGDIVLLSNKNEKRNSWPLAMVKEVKTSSDGLVRSATLEIMSDDTRKRFQRPITDLIILIPSQKSDNF